MSDAAYSHEFLRVQQACEELAKTLFKSLVDNQTHLAVNVVSHAICQNPDTPPEVLRAGALLHPDEVCNNPVLQLLWVTQEKEALAICPAAAMAQLDTAPETHAFQVAEASNLYGFSQHEDPYYDCPLSEPYTRGLVRGYTYRAYGRTQHGCSWVEPKVIKLTHPSYSCSSLLVTTDALRSTRHRVFSHLERGGDHPCIFTTSPAFPNNEQLVTNE